MAESGQEKTEEATQKRRIDSRKRGSVAKSVDLTNALVMCAMLAVLPSTIALMGNSFMTMIKGGLESIPVDGSFQHILRYTSQLLRVGMLPLGIILACAMVVGLVSNFAQVGFTLSPEAMIPNFKKLNPFAGVKNFVSFNNLFTGMKAFAKAGLFAFLAYLSISANWNRLGNLSQLGAAPALAVIGELLRAIAVKIAIAWIAIAAIDYIVQRKQYEKNIRMTKEEVKREYKESESNPEMKAQRIRRMRRLIRSRMRQAIQSADVIVTNPTHFSVAIKYEAGKGAPTVVAKGQDFLAFKIREFAKEYEVPIVPNPPLARALYRQCEIGDYVPRELFQPVAEVLAYVYKTLKQVRANSPKTTAPFADRSSVN